MALMQTKWLELKTFDDSKTIPKSLLTNLNLLVRRIFFLIGFQRKQIEKVFVFSSKHLVGKGEAKIITYNSKVG